MPKFLHKMVVGIDVSADFSVVAILSPNGEIYKNPFRIEHDLNGFRKLELVIKKEKRNLMISAVYSWNQHQYTINPFSTT